MAEQAGRQRTALPGKNSLGLEYVSVKVMEPFFWRAFLMDLVKNTLDGLCFLDVCGAWQPTR